MARARLGFCQALGRPCSVGSLPENRGITVTIRLERNAPAVGGPDRKAISATECESPHGARAGQIVDPDNRLLPIVAAEGDLFAVG